MKRFSLFSESGMQLKSLDYIRDNEDYIAEQNQNMLRHLSFFYTIMLVMYYVASITAFASWNVKGLYATALIIQVVVMVAILIRYTKVQRKNKELDIVCSIFQLYVMFFVAIMSIVPVELKQPAVYYAPIVMAFVPAFVFSWNRMLTLSAIEVLSYIIAAYVLKDNSVFFIDFFSSILALIMSIFIASALYNHRIKENETQKKLRRMGELDLLTDLYNKVSAKDKCEFYISRKHEEECALLILDFDDFKDINDNFGHQQGDAVLRGFGYILNNEAGTDHIAGRIGGDEFMLFLTKCQGETQALECGQRILKQLMQIRLKGRTDTVFTCSIGIDYAKSGEQRSYEEMLARADKALYEVKKHGKGKVSLYQPSIDEL